MFYVLHLQRCCSMFYIYSEVVLCSMFSVYSDVVLCSTSTARSFYVLRSPSPLTRQHPEALHDLLASLLQGDAVLADHQAEHHQGHELAGVRLEGQPHGGGHGRYMMRSRSV